MKNPTRSSYLVTAIYAFITILSPTALVGFLWWRSTLSYEAARGNIAVFVAGFGVAAMLYCAVLFITSLTADMLKKHREQAKYKAQFAALDDNAVARIRVEISPEEFFAAHRGTLMKINELILNAAAQPPQPATFYNHHCDDRYILASAAWRVELTHEQEQLITSLGGHMVYITLNEDSIVYDIELRRFIYVLQYCGNHMNWQHLGGKWYFSKK
jgi:hypothetical protein